MNLRRIKQEVVTEKQSDSSALSGKSKLTVRLLSLWKVITEVWNECERDDVLGRSAQLAYYFLFSLFPALLFLATLLAFLPVPNLLDNLLFYLGSVLPVDAFKLIRGNVRDVLGNQRPGLLSFALFAALWGASSAMGAIIYSLNIAYSVQESRSWWRQRILAIVLTIGMTIFVMTALTLIFAGGYIGEKIAMIFGFGTAFHIFYEIARWPFIVGFVLFGLDLIYFLAPNKKMKWKWVTPGAVFALVCWLLISFGLRHYVGRFANYNATYGSIGGVIVLMLWFYLTGLVILIGGEINSVLGRTS
jgi:membrane protein